MADALQRQQRGVRDLPRQRLAVRYREQRIGGAMYHQRRHHDVDKGAARAGAGIEVRMVGHRRDVEGSVNDALDDRAHPGLVKTTPHIRPLARDEHRDHGLPVRPVRLRPLTCRIEIGRQLGLHRRQTLRCARQCGGGIDQG